MKRWARGLYLVLVPLLVALLAAAAVQYVRKGRAGGSLPPRPDLIDGAIQHKPELHDAHREPTPVQHSASPNHGQNSTTKEAARQQKVEQYSAAMTRKIDRWMERVVERCGHQLPLDAIAREAGIVRDKVVTSAAAVNVGDVDEKVHREFEKQTLRQFDERTCELVRRTGVDATCMNAFRICGLILGQP